ncbi:sugar ABC transporter substrate-binding protein [Nocardioides alcanivorans]|uniref:sugar ABC transporter substrate-binding protein n=1 Tax=Nocardioides alcanivorans TaxID=2897352 RepID=UPI001F314C78|nr:sugar ABC transporter substrate-binding protein [Nocardioides alcanivorans]
MATRLSVAAIGAAAVLTAATLSACSGTTSTAGTDRSISCTPTDPTVDSSGPLAGKTITYVGGVPGVVLLDGIAQGLATSLNELGANVVGVYQLNAQNKFDLGAANQRMREAIAQKVDAIVLFPLDANSVRLGIEEAKAAGIPVFVFQDIDGVEATGKVAFPDEERGREVAEAFAKVVGGGEAAIISGPPSDNVDDAVKGTERGLEAGGMTIVGDADNQRNMTADAANAQKIAQGILAKNPDLDGLVVFNAESATGAIAAAKQAGVADHLKIATLAGEDINMAQVEDGQISMAFDFNGIAIGQTMAAELIAPYLETGSVQQSTVKAPLGELYTSENVEDFTSWCERIQYVNLPSTY